MKEQELAVEEAAAKEALSLVESVRRDELDKAKREQRERENRIRAARGLPPLPDDDETAAVDDAADAVAEAEGETADEPEDELDILLREAANILADFIRVSGAAGDAPTLVGVGGGADGVEEDDLATHTP
mgnify:FL=1